MSEASVVIEQRNISLYLKHISGGNDVSVKVELCNFSIRSTNSRHMKREL